MRTAARTGVRSGGSPTGEPRPRTRLEAAGPLRLLVDTLNGFMWQADPVTLRTAFVTEGAGELLGYPPGRWGHEPDVWSVVVDAADRDRVAATLRATAADGRDRDVEFGARSADGRSLTLRHVVRLIGSDAGTELWGLTTDITEEVRAARERRSSAARFRALSAQAAEFRRRSLEDPLTGLPNRVLLEDRLSTAIASARRVGNQCAVLLMDLDRFKEINDTRGHKTGDAVLRHVALRLRVALRAQDTASRLGGDEFVAVLPNADLAGAVRAAERILRALAEAPPEVDGKWCDVGISIGVALFPTHGTEGSDLLAHADEAMYRAKRAGGGYALSSGSSRVAVVRASRPTGHRGRTTRARRSLVLLAAALGVSAAGAVVPMSHGRSGTSGAERLDAAAVALTTAPASKVGAVVGTVEATIDGIPWREMTDGEVADALRAIGGVLADMRSEVAAPLRDRVERLLETIQTAETVARLTEEDHPAAESIPDHARRDPAADDIGVPDPDTLTHESREHERTSPPAR